MASWLIGLIVKSKVNNYGLMQKLLIHLFGIHALTGNEWPLISFIRDYVRKHIPEAKLHMDKFGNLYITKGEAGVGYPALACHLCRTIFEK